MVMGMGGRPGRPHPARDAHQPLLVRRNYLLRPRDIAFPDEVMRSRVWPTLGLGYYVSQPFDPWEWRFRLITLNPTLPSCTQSCLSLS